MLMEKDKSCLLIVDVQERLVPVMNDPRRVIQNCGLLLKAAKRLGVPTIVTEQYPQGIGPTVPDFRDLMDVPAFPKLHFSCTENSEILGQLKAFGRDQVVVAGIEAHICVLQTALGLVANDFDVFVVADACSSRRPENEALAQARLRDAGVSLVSVEMVLFEWLHRAGTPEFKDLVSLVK